MKHNPEDDEEEEEPEEDLDICANCEGCGCSLCDFDGLVDLNYLEPNGVN